MKEIEMLKVGETYPVFKFSEEEKIVVDINDTGMDVIVGFKCPTNQEISQFNEKVSFEVRYVVLSDIIFFLFRFGNLAWMDAPFTPHLAPNLSTYDLLEDMGENQGLAMHLYFCDCADGTLKNMRMIGLNSNFSKMLMGDILEISMKPFHKNNYDIQLGTIYSKYPTKELLKFSKERYKI